MSPEQSIAVFLSLFALWFLYQRQATCVRCGGRGRHRRDCPFDAHDDASSL
jgi:hypothetical protein